MYNKTNFDVSNSSYKDFTTVQHNMDSSTANDSTSFPDSCCEPTSARVYLTTFFKTLTLYFQNRRET